MWIVRLVVDDENLTKDIYETIEAKGLKFNLKYGSQVVFFIQCTDVLKGLEILKELNQKFKRRFNNNIYEVVSKRGRAPEERSHYESVM